MSVLPYTNNVILTLNHLKHTVDTPLIVVQFLVTHWQTIANNTNIGSTDILVVK